MNVAGLEDYIAIEGARPAVWGERDCCLFPAGWVLRATGVDPAAAWRGAYASRREAWALIRARGGIERAIGEDMAAAGFVPTSDPMSGDVGLVEVAVGLRRPVTLVVGAIRVGRLWAVKAHLGMVAGRYPVRAAWSVIPV